MHTVHIGYYHEMMRDIPEQIEALDALISQHLDREINKLDTVEHAILLIGAYELQNRLEIPYKVVLDEAMKLNNHFGATDAHKLINAVLDRMAIELRDIEVQADSKANIRTSQKAAAKPVVKTDNSANSSTDTDTNTITEKPTASNKPRISANNATIKRNSASKALANITDYKASKQNDTQNTGEETNIESASIEPVSADKANDIAASAENIVNDQPVEENINDSNDNTAADVESVDSKIVNVDIKDDKSDSVELNDTDEKSQD